MKISVIIPLYNQKDFIQQSIESILQQTYQNFEIIVVNDGSTDNPHPVLEKYKKDILLIQQNNCGLSAARNTGLRYASGDYIQFLDADDFLHPEKLELQLRFMTKIDSKVSYCEIYQLEELTGSNKLRYIGPLNNVIDSLYKTWLPYPLPIHSLIFKKEIFDNYGKFTSKLNAAEDRFFLSNIAINGEIFNYYPFIGGARRLHSDNMNLNRKLIYINMIEYYKLVNKSEKLRDYFNKNSDFGVDQLMNASITYMFFQDIAKGISLYKIAEIFKILRSENIKFTFEPIPCGHFLITPFFSLCKRVVYCSRRIIKYANYKLS
jgi:glycosyltransferase involved in cell wall biosynthesis